MDLPATQVCEDELIPTQPVFHSTLCETVQDEVIEIGMLCVDSKTYSIKSGINTIGRHPNCNIKINDQTVSKKHAEIEANETSAWICDLNSSNKTNLNNTILRPGRCYELKHGTVLRFGTVRAIYKVLRNMDESLIPEPSMSSLQQKQQTVIPGTPDSSVNDSPSFGRNSSIIPATQAENIQSIFRLPTLPLRVSMDDARRSTLQESSADSSVDDSRSSLTGEKENVDEKKIDIHDMETQKPFEANNENAVNIHSVETQKICPSTISTPPYGPVLKNHEVNIHNTDVQPKIDVRRNVTDVYDAETPRCVDIREAKTSKKVGIQNETSGSDSTKSVEITQMPENKNEKRETTDGKSGINNTLGASCSNETRKLGDNTEYMKGIEKNPQSDLQEYLQLQSPTSPDGELSEHDMSRNKLGSQDLLANFVYDVDMSNDATSKSLTPTKIVRTNDDNDSNGKSSDDENIFEAATQITNAGENAFQGVTERVKYSFKTSLPTDDSDETNNECVFQKYLRISSQDTEKAAKSQGSDSDSATDEEGHFMEVALKEKKAANYSFEMLQRNHQNVTIKATSSTDSEDMFDILTQPINSKNKNSSIQQCEANKANVDIDTPTVVINREDEKNDLKANENVETEEVDYVASTQILPTAPSIVKPGPSNSLISTKVDSDENDITEMEDNTPIQILSCSKKSLGTVQLRDTSDLLESVAVEECSIENIDYETASTQLISEVEKKKSASHNKSNLDDTLERNLNKMFDEESGQCIQEQPQISTQSLQNMLQSQCDNKTPTKNQEVNVEAPSPDIIPKKSTKRRRTKASSVPSSSTPISNRSEGSVLINRNTDTDSQNSDNYFITLTSARKRNIITDSQDSPDVIGQKLNTAAKKEQTSTGIINSADHESSINCHTPLKSKTSSTPSSVSSALSTAKLSTTSKIEVGNVDENELRNVNNQSSTAPDGEHAHKIFTLLQDDDEDIMAGLPEVKIAGTVSNPPSPTSSVSSDYRINVNNNGSKPISIIIAPKRIGAPRKTSRKAQSRTSKSVTEPYRTASKLNSSTILGSAYNSLSNNLDADNVTRNEDDGKVNKKSKSTVRRTRTENSCRSQTKDSLAQTEFISSIDLQTKTRQSPCIQRNGRTRSYSKENVDRSFVFQVGKEVPVEKTTVEPVNKNTWDTSRIGKRLRSMADTLEAGNAKKRKEDVKEGVINTRKRITGARRQSANILNYMNKRNSPTIVNESGNVQVTSNKENMIKKAVIKLVRVSTCTPTGSIFLSNPVKLESEIKRQNKSELSRCASVAASHTDSNVSSKENKKTGQKVATQRRANRTATAKVEQKVKELNCEIGEESQEVEMIMNGSLNGQSTSSNVETKMDANKNLKSVTKQKSRKRRNTNVKADLEKPEHSTASELSDSDIALYDLPISKVKRAKVSKNTSGVPSTAINKPARRINTKSKQTTRSTQSQQQPSTDSSVEEQTKSTISQASLDRIMNTATRSTRGRAKKEGEIKVGKEQNKGNKAYISPETNSSIETVLMPSTPSRARRSISSSFAASSPSRMKHKILFTGIPSNEYSKLLIKLNAIQVEDPAKCTVLVTDKVRRTIKFLCALALSIPIVSVDWLIGSEKAGHFVNLEDYILQDSSAEDKFGFKLGESLKKSNERKLLEGYTIVLTPNITVPPLPELKSIITKCGGKVLLRPPTSWPQKAVIVSREEDLGSAKKFLAKASKGVTIQSTEFILTGILRQELNFTEFKLK